MFQTSALNWVNFFRARVWIQLLKVFSDLVFSSQGFISITPENIRLENPRFSEISRGYRNGTLARDGLTKVERLVLIALAFVVFRWTVVKIFGICFIDYFSTLTIIIIYKSLLEANKRESGNWFTDKIKRQDSDFFIYNQDHHYW